MGDDVPSRSGKRTIPLEQAVGTVLAHDITEIRPGEFKGPAFRKGHIVRQEDICHLQRLGKQHLFVLNIAPDEMHENDAVRALAAALIGRGAAIGGEPREGKIKIVAGQDGLLKVDRDALLAFNMVGEIMCATLHSGTVVKKGRTVAETRAIPLVIGKKVVDEAVRAAKQVPGVIEVRSMRKPRAGAVITGNEVYSGMIRDAFAPLIRKKIKAFGGELIGVFYAQDTRESIVEHLQRLVNRGADLLITTGGLSVDPDDVTRFAVRDMGASDIVYGSPALPGSMFLIAYLGQLPVIGIPACALSAQTTIFDLVLPAVLAGERIGRREVAALGHGGLCLKCKVCRYPVCPFGKSG